MISHRLKTAYRLAKKKHKFEQKLWDTNYFLAVVESTTKKGLASPDGAVVPAVITFLLAFRPVNLLERGGMRSNHFSG